MSFGIILRVYELLMPFLMRTVIIYYMGLEYAGLNGLLNSVLQVLNMAELGVGSAMVFSMYRPIAENETHKICALMRLYRQYYRLIGIVVGFLGLLILPWIPDLVKKGVPAGIDITVLYLLHLTATVLSYWLYAYKGAVLTAHQRNDLISKVRMGVLSIQYTVQIICVILWKNYYVFLITSLVCQVIINVTTALMAHKKYPQYTAKGYLEKSDVSKINQRISDLFVVKLGNVVVSCADTIVISAFLGLSVLAIYQNYFTILSAVTGTISVVYNAILAGVGNSLVVETKEKNFSDFRKLTFAISWITGFCTCCFLCLYQTFMEIWMGAEHLMEMNAVVCLCVYFYLYELSRMFDTYKDAAGIWRKDRLRLLVTSFVNLGLNLLVVRTMGIYGVLLSTIVAFAMVGLPWMIRNLFSEVFGWEHVFVYVKQLINYAVVAILGCVLTYGICNLLPPFGWASLIIRGIICCIVPNLLFFLVYYRREELDYYKSIMQQEISRFLKRKCKQEDKS